MKRVFIFLLSIISVSLIYGCSINNDSPVDDTPSEIVVPDSTDMFTDADKNLTYDEDLAYTINLSESSVTSSSNKVTITNNLITINEEGTYVVRGTKSDITIIIDATNAKVRLILADVTITNSDFAAIYVKNADKVFLVLEGENSLSVTGEYTMIDDNKVDGAIFAKDNITILGDGTLDITSSKHGIVGKDDIKITNGNINISAASHGIQANDSVRIAEANLDITSGKDGIQVENTEDDTKGFVYVESGYVKIVAGYDGIDASGTVQILKGILNITSGGGSGKTALSTISTKGIKAQKDMSILGGEITVNSSDDSIHSNNSIEISGGTFELSSGDDGIHADTSLIISDGNISITKSYEGLEAQNISITGGKINITASDDGMNAAGGADGSSIGGRPGQNSFTNTTNAFISISGGEIYINANGDGIDSNGNLTVSGGTTIVEGPTSGGDGALDYDGSGTITGGTIIAIGSSEMAMNFSSATQGSILVNVGNQNAKTTIILKDSEGNQIVSLTTTKSYSSVVISPPLLLQGQSYVLSVGSSSQTITLSSLLYGSSSGMGGNIPDSGNRPGGMGRP